MTESNICIDCICLPSCLNKTTTILVSQCKLMTNEILNICDSSSNHGGAATLYFFHLEKTLRLEIYIDTVYIIESVSSPQAVMGIDRRNSSRWNTTEIL